MGGQDARTWLPDIHEFPDPKLHIGTQVRLAAGNPLLLGPARSFSADRPVSTVTSVVAREHTGNGIKVKYEIPRDRKLDTIYTLHIAPQYRTI